MSILRSSLLFVLVLISVLCKGQDFLRVSGKKIINAKGEEVLLRGIGLGGWMIQEGYMLHINESGQQFKIRKRIDSLIGREKTAGFYMAWLQNQTTKSDIDSLHAWGFNSVRLPMHFNLYTLPIQQEPVSGKNTWLSSGFELTDSLISWCRVNGMRVILDLHAAPGGQGNDLNISDRDELQPSLWQSEANRKKTIALWHEIALRYAKEPVVAGYDILNEPNWGFEDSLHDRNGLHEEKNIPLTSLMKDITRSIRSADKNHIIIIEGNGWGNNYRGILPPWDDNMVLSFHKYWNYNDIQSIQHILDLRNQYNIPVWLGETGENSNTWFTDAIRLFESNHIGWSWWPLKKLGNNNPLQIPSNPAYDSLTAYWNGKLTVPPSGENAYKALMQLAADSKCERNTVHRDVIDAMIRQPFSDATLPFLANEISDGTTIAAVDYDLGINGEAYYDLDTANFRISAGKESIGNRGRAYRNDGVDIFADSLLKGKYIVGSIEDGEWLQYTIYVPGSAKYHIILDVVYLPHDIRISLSDGDSAITGEMKIPAQTSSEKESKITFGHIPLSAGVHKIRMHAIKGGFKLVSLTFQADRTE